MNKNYINRLLDIVYTTRENEKLSIGGANALTLLVAACYCFSGADLSGIKVPGANLRNGIFDHTNFKGADLS
jgi:uncharacterized protein YjbI with pentapeptide repeats